VLETAGAQWNTSVTQLGQPAVPGYQAAIRLPLKPQQQLPACLAGFAGPPPEGGGFTFSVQLFGAATNITYLNSSQELLPGNTRFTVEVQDW
jgi:hypothetical protein